MLFSSRLLSSGDVFPSRRSMSRNVVASLVAAATLSACASMPRMPVPEALVLKAKVAGYSNIRFVGKTAPMRVRATVREMINQRRGIGRFNRSASMNFLALSGGGADGAFGAGLLNGWTERGGRPEFDVVTGISAGGLLAPFAFLGSRYDDQLMKIFTSFGTSDLLSTNIFGALLGDTAISEATGFENIIARFATQEIVDAVADEHLKGRRLLIGTTNIDAERAVFWDMGAIAASGQPDSLQLFRKILQASASIPALFPAVRIKVTVNGETYDEMHVDGGVTRQVFFLPSREVLGPIDREFGLSGSRNLYVILNGRSEPTYEVVDPDVLSITGRSILTLIKNQANGDLASMRSAARSNNIRFRLASIPRGFMTKPKEKFDRNYMIDLFDFARELRLSKRFRWATRPVR